MASLAPKPTDTPPPNNPPRRILYSGYRKRKALNHNIGFAEKKSSIKCLLLNCDGLSRVSLQDITDVVNSKNVDIVVCVETHHRAEANYDDFDIEGFKVFEARRSDVANDRPGGGISVYCKTSDGLISNVFNPNIDRQELVEVRNERLWVLTETQGCKTAFCALYLGCQYPDDRYAEWNSKIYQLVMLEQSQLRHKGYRICLVGDFNGHVGNTPGLGIKGNSKALNNNGRRLLKFQKDAELSMINNMCTNYNGNCSNHICKPVCSGKWTRQRGTDSSIIDFFYVSKEHANTVISMTVDDAGDWGGDSDHNFCLLEMRDSHTVLKVSKPSHSPPPRWNICEDQDWSKFSNFVSSNMCKIVKNSVDNFAKSVSALLKEAMTKTIGLKPVFSHKPRAALPSNIVQEIKRRRSLVKVWKNLLLQFNRDKASIPVTEPSALLINAERALNNQRQVVKDMLCEFDNRQRKINIEKCIGTGKKASKNFWSFVNGKKRKSSSINAVFNSTLGILKTDPGDIAEETTSFLKDLFNGEFTPLPPGGRGDHNHTSDHSYSNNIPECANTTDHEYSKNHKSARKLISNDDSNSLENDPAGFLDSDFSANEIVSAISSMQSDKAMGWDILPNECFMHSPVIFQMCLVDLFNAVKNSNILPRGWNQGRVVLVHKKGPTELLTNYRPLTVNISITSLYSRVLNARLSSVVETHDLLGEIQSGFRPDRSCSDNSFILSTIMWKARAKGQTVHKAYIDIMKAYDTVDRHILWERLGKLGLGPKFISCIKNMYKDDCISTEVCGVKTRTIFQSRGVRQGCSLSPLLFALYLSDLCDDLSRSTLGFNISGTIISGLFFADDLVLFSYSAKGLIDLIALVNHHCDVLKIRISVAKSNVISPDDDPFTIVDQFGDEVLSLEKVAMYKYLGIEMFQSIFKTGSEKQKKAISMANSYKFGCLNMSRRGPDSTILASTLWAKVALPAILFGTDCIPFSDTTITDIDRIQSQVCKSILSLSKSAPNFVAQTELGLPGFGHVLYQRQLNACLRWLQMPQSRWAGLAMREHLSNAWDSPYWRYICSIKDKIGILCLKSKNNIKTCVTKYYMDKLNKTIVDSNIVSLRPIQELSRATYVCEDKLSSLMAGVKVNYCSDFQCQGIDRSRKCPVCPNNVKSSEFHVLFECPVVVNERKSTGIQDFITLCRLHNIQLVDSFYLYVQCKNTKSININLRECMARANSMKIVRDKWYKQLVLVD